jgi:hypothetical protein
VIIVVLTDESLKDRIEQMFPLPCYSFLTRGLGDGIIFKFKTFYLKIYDEDISYDIKGYRYNEGTPIFETTVKENLLTDFCSRFTKEDYLTNIKINI